MSITRLQQARQMYATGQRVAKTLDGSRPGYRGDYSYGDSSSKDYDPGEGKNQAGKSAPTASSNKGSDNYKAPTYDTAPTVQQMTDARRDFDVGVAGGYAKDSGNMFIGPMPYGTTIDPYQQFRSYRPEVRLPKFTPTGFLADTFFRKPIQKFADFTAEKNRNYFMDEVVRAGRIPGLNYGTVSEMTNEELEAAYKSYLSDRLNNKTDAYGNPNPGYDGGGGGAMEGIATLYNNNMFDDTEENDPFVFRYAGEDSTLNPEAAGVNSVAELRDLQLERAKNIYT
jgi:hypothetical protein